VLMRQSAAFANSNPWTRERLDTKRAVFTMFALCNGVIEHHIIEKLSGNF